MNKFISGYHVFQRVLILCTAGILFYIGLLAVANMSKISLPFIFGCMVIMLLIMALLYAFRTIEKMSAKSQWILAGCIFLGMSLVHLLLALSYGIRPNEDSFDDIDTAYYLLDNKEVTLENYNAKYMKAFGNNYFYVLVLREFLRFGRRLPVENYVRMLTVLNSLFIMLAVAFAWLAMKEAFSIKKANKLLCFMALNPISYLLVYWVYTASMSLWISMGILYVTLKLYKSKAWAVEGMLGGVLGILFVLGYKLRPNSIFILIAIVLVGFGIVCKYKMWRKLVVVTICFLIFAGGCYGAEQSLEKKCFGQVAEYNRPLSFWISMGSHDNGRVDEAGKERSMLKNYSKAEASEKLLKNAINNYYNQGLVGTANLWLRKSVSVWGDNYSEDFCSVYYRLVPGEHSGKIYELLVGNTSCFTKLYAQAFRVITIFGMLILCIMQWKKQIRGFDRVQWITIFGGILFYLIWENKPIYSIPYLPTMFMLATSGMEELSESEGLRKKVASWNKKTMLAYGMLVLLLGITLCGALGEERIHRISLINSTALGRNIIALETENSLNNLCQDFYVEEPFNQLSFLVEKPESNSSSYELIISNGEGDTLIQRKIHASEIIKQEQKQYLTVNLFEKNTDAQNNSQEEKKIIEGGHYYVRLIKLEAEKQDIVFMTRRSYLIDSYRGELYINGTLMGNDLIMDVNREETGALASVSWRIAAFVLWCAGAWSIPYLFRKKYM